MTLKRLLPSVVSLFILMFFGLTVFAQTKVVTGKVTDAEGNGVPGVTAVSYTHLTLPTICSV